MTNSINPELIPEHTLVTGVKIPCIGMGTFGSDRFSPDQVADAVEGALRFGYRLFDCAAIYGNEHLIGEVFSKVLKDGVAKREELFITSKVWNDMHEPGDVLISIKKTLTDLQVDYIDAYFVHWPFPNYHAPGCDGDARNPDSKPFSVERFMDTWQQMEECVELGLAGSIGMSNMTVAKLKAVLPLCRIKPSLIEMELHPAFQQPELFEYCIDNKILPIGFCPIGSPTRPERDKTPDDISATQMPEIVKIAKAHNVHPAVVCIKWAVQRGQIPIPFSVVEDEYKSNLRCVTEDPLTDEEMQIIANADKNCRLIKGQVFLWESATDWRALWDENGIISE
jgi:alcohol dehydrogenase (NADP+)